MRFAPQGKPHAHCGACTGKGSGAVGTPYNKAIPYG